MPKITDKGLIALAQGCPNIQEINLRKCKLITEQGLIVLAQNCPNIEKIYLADELIIFATSLFPKARNLKYYRDIEDSNDDSW